MSRTWPDSLAIELAKIVNRAKFWYGSDRPFALFFRLARKRLWRRRAACEQRYPDFRMSLTHRISPGFHGWPAGIPTCPVIGIRTATRVFRFASHAVLTEVPGLTRCRGRPSVTGVERVRVGRPCGSSRGWSGRRKSSVRPEPGPSSRQPTYRRRCPSRK